MAQVPHTALVIGREEARRRLQERIDQAKEILPGNRWSSYDLLTGEERERKWRAYNRELLSRIFTTDEYARDYDLSKISIRQVQDRYFDISADTFAGRILGSVRKQVAHLDSVIERLELIDEAMAGGAGGSLPQGRSKVFVVHGRDDGEREGVARFLEKIGLTAIILADGEPPFDAHDATLRSPARRDAASMSRADRDIETEDIVHVG